jgi:hypothetical protein
MSVAGLAEAAQAVSTSAVADAASLVAWQLLVTWTETPSVARRWPASASAPGVVSAVIDARTGRANGRPPGRGLGP